MAEVVLEESAAVARARGIDDAELGGGSRDGRAGGDSVAGKDGRVVLVEGSDVHLATLRHGGEGSLRHEGVATEEGVAGGALAVAGLAHQHDRELLGGGHGDAQGCDALEARRPREAHRCAAADDQIARRRGTQTTGVSEGARCTASHFFSFSRIHKCTLCVHTGAKRSTLGAFDIRGTCWTSEISSGAVVVENAPSSPIWWSQRRAPTVPRGGGDERPRALDRLSPSSYPFAREAAILTGAHPRRTPPPAPRFNIPRTRLVRDASSS